MSAHFATNHKLDYTGQAWYVQALGVTHRAGRKPPSAVAKPVKDKPKRRILGVDYLSPSDKSGHDATRDVSTVHLGHADVSIYVSLSSVWGSTMAASNPKASTTYTPVSVPDQQVLAIQPIGRTTLHPSILLTIRSVSNPWTESRRAEPGRL